MSKARDLSDLPAGGGDINIDDGTLFVDASENRVGIGTSSPASLFHAAGDVYLGSPSFGSGSEVTINNSVGGVGNSLTIKNSAASLGGRGVRINFNSNAYTISRIESATSGGNDSGDIRFFTANSGTLSEGMRINTNGCVFNEVSANQDFRVESDSNTHALFVDASEDRIGIKTNSVSDATLTVFGDGVGNYNAIQIRSSNASNANKGGLVSFARHDDADTSFVGFAGFDNGSDRALYIGGGGWSMEETTIVNIYAGAYDAGSSGAPIRLTCRNDESVFNDSGNNHDFRVESENNANAFFVDAGRDLVRIGSNGGYTATIIKNLNVSPSSSQTATFAINSEFGIGSTTDFHFEIDAGSYGNSLSGPGVFKLVGGGFSNTDGNNSTNTIVNQQTNGSWSFSQPARYEYAVTLTNTSTTQNKLAIVKMTCTWVP